jgi:hypothetical protein
VRYEAISLVTVAWAAGGALLALAAPLLGAPARVRLWAGRFPRNALAARVLTAVCVMWAAWLLAEMPMGALDAYKRLLYVLAPLTYWLVVVYLDELLAARALGGLLMLIPGPMLGAARWHPSAARLVIVVLAYGLAVAGVALMLAPFRLRRWTAALARTDARCRIAGGVLAALGLLCLALGLTLFRPG